MKNPAAREDPEQHLCEERAGIGEEEEGRQHKEEWDVLNVVLVGSEIFGSIYKNL
ncbi:hypothetical protein E2C01_095600 [Portunus trituberculatus]|uniref:Uncharacterized protein n=1 Tax=Portunus trituberculatus TaxID=210409 RepID=A0A5B7JZT7_PORTR|nr:hypothetical protein [Portunus trituberculatus]